MTNQETTSAPRNIVLTGPRGTGKTTVSLLLRSKLKRPVIDTDERIVAVSGMPIPQIVEAYGWEHFRDLESAVAQGLAGERGLIIATGGGMILREQNVAGLKRNGWFVLLCADATVRANRIGNDPNRPALTALDDPVKEQEKIWADRKAVYEGTADLTIWTDDMFPHQIVKQIILAQQMLTGTQQ